MSSSRTSRVVCPGNSLDEAMNNAAEAIALWIETVLDEAATFLPPGPSKRTAPAQTPAGSGLVDIDPALVSDKAERVNITLPARLLRRIVEHAKARHESRSGFLAQLTAAWRGHRLRARRSGCRRTASDAAPW